MPKLERFSIVPVPYGIIPNCRCLNKFYLNEIISFFIIFQIITNLDENAILYLNRCVPDKHTDSCNYLDAAAILEKNLQKEQKQILELIPEVPQGRA